MGARVLVADDSATIQKTVQLTLSRQDVELIQVQNGDDAMQKAREVKPDLMLIDHAMPGRAGQELCGAIRQDPQLKDVPIILMAGISAPVDEAEARRAGATDVVVKPFESQTLIEKVKQVLSGEVPAAVAPEYPAPLAREEVAVETGEEAFVLEPQEVMAEEMKIPAGVTGEEAPLEIVAEEPSDEPIPTYDLSTEAVELPMEQALHEDAQPSPASERELAIEDMAAAVGFGTSATTTVGEKAPDPVPAPSPVHEAPASSAGPVMVSPDMVEDLARQVAERVASHIVRELRGELIQRVEKLLWEVVPDLAEQLITQEIKRIRELVEGTK